jgi:hypothetical protein
MISFSAEIYANADGIIQIIQSELQQYVLI